MQEHELRWYHKLGCALVAIVLIGGLIVLAVTDDYKNLCPHCDTELVFDSHTKTYHCPNRGK